jgi:ketosteroid isomerase-like protein
LRQPYPLLLALPPPDAHFRREGDAMSVDDVLAANESFYRAFNQKDNAAMSALWADAADVTCVHPGWNVLTGREPVLESWARILSNPDQPRIMTGGAEARIVGDVGIVICRELVGGTPLAATNVFIQQNGAWRMIHHHSGPVALVG